MLRYLHPPMFGGSSAAGAYQSIGFGATTDAVYLPVANGGDGSLHLTEAFGMKLLQKRNTRPLRIPRPEWVLNARAAGISQRR